MSSYERLIRELAPARDPREVEAYLRLEHGTLDHLSREAFRQEVEAAGEMIDADPALAAELADSVLGPAR